MGNKSDRQKKKDSDWMESAISKGRETFKKRDPSLAANKAQSGGFLEMAKTREGSNTLASLKQVVAPVCWYTAAIYLHTSGPKKPLQGWEP